MKTELYKEILSMAIGREIEAAIFYQDVCDKTADSNLKDHFLAIWLLRNVDTAHCWKVFSPMSRGL